MSIRSCLNWLGLLTVVVGLPLAVHRVRGHSEPRCDFDNKKVDPACRVDIVDSEGRAHVFCCPSCALAWLARQPDAPRSITVTDEVSGQRIDAARAIYVRSSALDTQTTGRRLHVFRNSADAEKHADTFAGDVLSDSERPFRR
jgi:hypothetical protein